MRIRTYIFHGLIMMPVQPEADPAQAETGATNNSIPPKRKTGARKPIDQTVIDDLKQRKKQNSSALERLCLLDLPAQWVNRFALTPLALRCALGLR